jgi:hypothetical protein
MLAAQGKSREAEPQFRGALAGRPPNAYVREDRILARLPGLHLLLAGTQPARRRRTRRGADTRPLGSPQEVAGYLRQHGVALTYDPAAGPCAQGPERPPRPSP